MTNEEIILYHRPVISRGHAQQFAEAIVTRIITMIGDVTDDRRSEMVHAVKAVLIDNP